MGEKAGNNTISIGSNAAFNILRVGVTLAVPLVLFPYVSRTLGPGGLGAAEFAESVVAYFVTIASLGVPIYGKLACARVRQQPEALRKTVCELLYISLALEAVAYGALLVTVFAAPGLSRYRTLLLLNSVTVLAAAPRMEWLHFALERFRYTALRAIACKLVAAVLIFAMVHSPDHVARYTAINVLTQAASAALDCFLARPYLRFYPLKALQLRRHVGPILAFVASAVAVSINSNTDIVMLNLLAGEVTTGHYTFAAKVKSILVSLMVAGLDAALPRLALLHRQGEDGAFRALLRQVGVFTFTAGWAAAVYFTVFARETALVLGGEAYAPAGAMVVALMAGMPVLAVNFVLGVGVLQSIGRERQYARTMLITCLVNAAANAVLIPALQGVGAALATLLAEVGNMALYYHFGKDYLGATFAKSRLAALAAVCVAAGAVCWWLKPLVLPGRPLWQMAACLAVYAAAVVPLALAVSGELRQLAGDALGSLLGRNNHPLEK